MRIQEVPTVRELALRTELAAAHLETNELRAQLIEVRQTLSRLLLHQSEESTHLDSLIESARAATDVTGLRQEHSRLIENYLQLEKSYQEAVSSRWWRMGHKVRSVLRRVKRVLSA